jgi:hypothetical protein
MGCWASSAYFLQGDVVCIIGPVTPKFTDNRASWSSCMVLQVKVYVQKKLLDSILEIDRRGGFDERTHLGQPFLSTVR